MPSSAKARVKVKKLKSKHEKSKESGRKTKSCGFGKIYDTKTKKCRQMTYGERQEEISGKAKGYVAGGYLGQTVGGPVGQVVCSAYGRYAGGKMTKKKMSGQAKKKK